MSNLALADGTPCRLESDHWLTEHRSGQACAVVRSYPSTNFPRTFRYVIRFDDGQETTVARRQLVVVRP